MKPTERSFGIIFRLVSRMLEHPALCRFISTAAYIHDGDLLEGIMAGTWFLSLDILCSMFHYSILCATSLIHNKRSPPLEVQDKNI